MRRQRMPWLGKWFKVEVAAEDVVGAAADGQAFVAAMLFQQGKHVRPEVGGDAIAPGSPQS